MGLWFSEEQQVLFIAEGSHQTHTLQKKKMNKINIAIHGTNKHFVAFIWGIDKNTSLKQIWKFNLETFPNE